MGRGSRLPTPAQGLVDGNQAGGGLGTAAGQPVLGLEQGPLGVQHLQEVAGAVFITYPRQARGRIAGAHGRLVVDQPVAGPGMRDQRILGFLERLEHGLFIAQQRAFLAPLGGADARLHVAEVEDAPGNAGREHVGVGAAIAQRAG